ncbi:MAG: MFS transporter [Providencia heimbachae]|nr:MFS transporter [Providencia heimbachae]
MRRIFLILAVCLGTFMATLDISIVNVALPAIGQDLDANMSMLQWIIDSYALCLSALILSIGPISDRYGRKKIWLLGIVIFTLGSGICAFSVTSNMLIVGRIVQGVAAAALIPGALSIITQAFTNDIERIKIIGIWSAVSALSLIIGPILGGFLVDTLN